MLDSSMPTPNTSMPTSDRRAWATGACPQDWQLPTGEQANRRQETRAPEVSIQVEVGGAMTTIVIMNSNHEYD